MKMRFWIMQKSVLPLTGMLLLPYLFFIITGYCFSHYKEGFVKYCIIRGRFLPKI